MRLTTLISLALIALSFTVPTAPAQPQPPDTLWTRTYGGIDTDIGSCVQQTTDGGYIIAGRTQSFGTGVYAAYLIKTDMNGDTLWTRVFSGNHWYDFQSVVQISDGGFAAVGTSSEAPGEHYVYFVKTDINGNMVWTRTYGGNMNDKAFCLQITSDGGFIICGYTESYGAGLYDVFLLKTNSSGHPSWFRTYGGSGVDYGVYVEQTTDGGYIITGSSSPYIGGYDVYLIRTDSLGNMLWERTFGGSYNDVGRCVRQTDDGGFIVAGTTSNNYSPADSMDVYLIKTDANGDSLWTRTYGGDYWDEGYSLDLTSDGGYIVSGFSENPPGTNLLDFYIVKIDSIGNENWSKTIGGFSHDWSFCVQRSSDGGYIVCGYTGSYGAGDADIWLVKLEAEYPAVTLNPLNHPIVIPSNGGNFTFDATVENATGDPFDFDSWTLVILPNGNIFGPLFRRNGLIIQPGMILTRQITQIVPGNAPAGNYIYVGNIGFYPDSLMDSDRFEFVKRP